ncbi:MAG: hypothetical protein JSR67_05580 [Proteobacteria bacterium]|nr:hypothetical protein [Pseudomonadota bacterium]
MPSASFALGLGDIHLNSALNSPLDARIDLIDVAPDEVNTVQAQLASRETFARYGLDFPAYLSNVQVRVQRSGQNVSAHVTSSDPITEPFVTLLVEVNWSRGHLVREYTVLLDPPLYTPGPTASGAAVAAPASGATAREGAIERSQPAAPAPAVAASPAPTAPVSTARAATEQAAPQQSAQPEPSAAPSGEGSHLVKGGETLSGIASGVSGAGAGSATTREWMLAIYQANPHAFEQNMNLLRKGAVLRIPDASTAQAVAPAVAAAEIRRQYTAWRGGAGGHAAAAEQPGRLKLVAPAQNEATAGGTGSAETSQLQNQVQQLQGELAESRRLLELKNAELARLQSQIAAKQGGAAAETTSPPPPPPATQAAAPAPAPAPAASAPTPPPAAAQEQHEAAPAVTPPAQPASAPKAPRRPAAHVTPESSGGILDTLKGLWWLLLLALAAVVGGLGAMRYLRARRETEFDDSLGRLAAAGAEAAEAAPANRPLSFPRDAGTDGGFLVEETGSRERPRATASAAPAATEPAPIPTRHVTSDDTISSETAINLDQGDPLAEADFHMAYGLYDQAADLVRIAISREPARRDLKLKLLEVFFVWGNKEQFLQTARELAASRDAAAPGEWEKILIMGKQIAPEDPIFAGGGAVSGATAGGVDLDLEGGQNRVDFDLHGEPTGEAAHAVDLDIGAAIGDTGASESPTNVTDRNAALLDSGILNVTGTTREMTARMARAGQTAEMEGPTVEQPALMSASPTLRLDAALRRGHLGEQTEELAVDDLGLDVGAPDTVEQPGPASAAASSPDAPTLVAGMDEYSRKVMEDAQHRGSGTDVSSTAVTGGWQFDPNELEAALTQTSAALPDPSATSRLAALGEHGVDVPLSEATGIMKSPLDLDVGSATGVHAATGHGVDLDVGEAEHQPVSGDAAFAATQRLQSEDLALPDLEPVTMSEVGTKLDLARAYMDMGDPEGARNILEEVLGEGTAAQKQEAQRLIESLPG